MRWWRDGRGREEDVPPTTLAESLTMLPRDAPALDPVLVLVEDMLYGLWFE